MICRGFLFYLFETMLQTNTQLDRNMLVQKNSYKPNYNETEFTTFLITKTVNHYITVIMTLQSIITVNARCFASVLGYQNRGNQQSFCHETAKPSEGRCTLGGCL